MRNKLLIFITNYIFNANFKFNKIVKVSFKLRNF